MTRPASRARWTVIAVAAVQWTALVAAWLAHALPPVLGLGPIRIPTEYLFAGVFGLAGLWGLLTWRRAKQSPTVATLATASLGYFPVWQAGVYAADAFGFSRARATLGEFGPAGAFLIGLGWLVWYVERRWNAYLRTERDYVVFTDERRIWNPLHPRAWYYGRAAAKLNQSLTVLGVYSLVFFGAFLLAGQLGGCREIYELPAGGGKQMQIAQTVQIQKVIRKKFVINPYSMFNFNPPPMIDITKTLLEATAHQYKVGQGDGAGAGYGGGTRSGKIRFIRLEYTGGDWNQDFGIGADLNMLIQYGVRTGQAVAEETESRTISQLENFPIGKSPPLVYLTGQKQISLSKSEVRTLREYLLDKHGMLFIDNGGSQTFHNQALTMMRQVVPEIEPVTVPLDDVIHRIPYQIPFLPYVAPHGGRDAKGWKLDGRWIAYYHPGDIGDAWSDGHSGVKAEVWEACYQLGVNVINYAHAEYDRWLDAQKNAK
jgi:hypothetical protein